MALSSTIFKAEIHIADNDRAYYASHQVTLARHPSETDERMMVRLLAYALCADEDEQLAFSKGLSDMDEPDLWRKDLTGQIQLWIETGMPDERRLQKAAGRSDEVKVYAYGRNVPIWWQGIASKLARFPRLSVYQWDVQGTQDLAALAQRSMQLHLNIQDGQVWVSSEAGVAHLSLQVLKAAAE